MSKPTVEEVLAHISEKPWSNYKESDYTLEQWHRACLIHQHDGDPTSKSQCKLPVRTPNGALNRNGVHAAAAALAGARGGVNASSDEKASATKVLRRCYSELGEDPPDSMMSHSGVKGMKWGVRKERDSSGPDSSRRGLSSGQKTALRVGAGAVAVAGTAYAVRHIMKGSGSTPVSQLSKPTINAGKKFVSSNNGQEAWKKAVSDLSADIAKATADVERHTRQTLNNIPGQRVDLQDPHMRRLLGLGN